MLLWVMLAGLALPDQEPVPPTGPPTTLPSVEVVGPVTEAVVELECRVSDEGRLTDCAVISETPSGQGFGDAARRAAGRARLNARTFDRAAAGAKVRFTTRFRLDDSGRPLT